MPPTVFFTPEITPFIKLFTKRVQLTKPVDPEVYAAAPWWEQRIYDGGERVLKVGQKVQLSQYPNRFLNSLIVAITSTVLAVGMGTLTAYGFSRFRVAGENDWLFFILSTRMLPPVVVAIPMFLMYRALGITDTHVGLIILYTAFNLSFSVWLMKGFIDEIRRVRGGGAGRRLHAHAGVLQDRAARGDHRHRGDRGLLLHHRLERVRLRADHDQPARADRAAVHPGADRLGADRLDDDRGGHLPVPAAGRDLHLRAAQPPAARRDLRRDPEVRRMRKLLGPRRLEATSQWVMVLGIIALVPAVELLAAPLRRHDHAPRADRLLDLQPRQVPARAK